MRQKVDANLLGDIVTGELESWYVGVCRVTFREGEDMFQVIGENDHVVGEVQLSQYNHGSHYGMQVADLTETAEEVNEIIEKEHQ